MNLCGYNGWCELTLDDSDIANLYQHQNIRNADEIKENEFIIVKNKSGKVGDKFIKKDNNISFRKISQEIGINRETLRNIYK